MQDHHVEQAVVDRGVGQQRHPGLEVADVADHDRAGPVAVVNSSSSTGISTLTAGNISDLQRRR